MRKLKIWFCLVLLFGFGFGNKVKFPMWPHWFTNFDAETFGMGDANLFSTGPSAILRNAANLDTIFYFVSSLAYESRKSRTPSLWEDKDEGCYPQMIGFTLPHIGRGVGGILFHKLMRWHGSAGDKMGTASLSVLSLGYCFLGFPKLKLGITANYVWGNSKYNYVDNDSIYESISNTYGFGIITSFGFPVSQTTKLVLRFMPPTILLGETTYRTSDTAYINDINDNVPWEINGGIEHNLISSLVVVSQITYRNWRRETGGFIWGDHEWQLHGGFELRPNSVFRLRLGSFIQQFYSDLEIPFLKFSLKGRARVLFLTVGIGMTTNFMQINMGVGKRIFSEHTGLGFYSKQESIIAGITLFPEKLFKKQEGGTHD